MNLFSFCFVLHPMLSSRILMLLLSKPFKGISLAFVITMMRTIDTVPIKLGLNETCRNSPQHYFQAVKYAFWFCQDFYKFIKNPSFQNYCILVLTGAGKQLAKVKGSRAGTALHSLGSPPPSLLSESIHGSWVRAVKLVPKCQSALLACTCGSAMSPVCRLTL